MIPIEQGEEGKPTSMFKDPLVKQLIESTGKYLSFDYHFKLFLN